MKYFLSYQLISGVIAGFCISPFLYASNTGNIRLFGNVVSATDNHLYHNHQLKSTCYVNVLYKKQYQSIKQGQAKVRTCSPSVAKTTVTWRYNNKSQVAAITFYYY